MTEIQKVKAEIKMLEKKLSFLEELEKTKSPVEEAFKRVYGTYPSSYDKSVFWTESDEDTWIAFQKGYTASKVDYKVGEYQPSQKTPEPEENEWKLAALRFGEKLSDIGPCGYYDFTAGEWVEWALNAYEKDTEPYCPDEPSWYDEIEHDISENVENKTLKEVINRWWMDTFTSKNQWDVDTCIDDLADQVEFFYMRNKK
jgi:hypothetical protein